nr:integrase, catalytic region, zinc finger, CCHC-type, peptidase aspartic, catalytic [Tanacetum cinerariifolium]
MGKSTRKTHKPKSKDTNQKKLYLLHMDLCEPMRVESSNGKKYILVIVDDYSRFTWVKFLRSKDETSDFIIKFLKMIQVRLKVPVRRIRTDNGTEVVNQTLRDYYEVVGISHETSVARSLQQNGVVERRNRTLIEAAHTIVVNQTPEAIAPIAEVIPLVIPQDVGDDNLDMIVAHMGNDLLFGVPIPEVTSAQSTTPASPQAIMQTNHPMPHHNNKWTKDHPLNNIIAMQEELNEFERLKMDVKTAFLNGNMRENVYISQLDGFVDPDNPNHVYKLKMALYGLKQASRAWYDMLSSFLLSQDFSKGSVDPTLFIRKNGNDLLLDYRFLKVLEASLSINLNMLLNYLRNMVLNLATQWILRCKIPMYCDNKSAIAFCCNNVQHSRSKHIDIRYHFIKEQVEYEVIELYFVNTEYQLADFFTKALGRDRIEFLTNKLGMRSFTPETLKKLMNEEDESMNPTSAEQIALDNTLVTLEARLTIGKHSELYHLQDYTYASGAKEPKKVRKFKKPASPKLKIVPVSPKEPTKKPAKKTTPAKKSSKSQARVIIKDTPGVSVSKKKAPEKGKRSKVIEIL